MNKLCEMEAVSDALQALLCMPAEARPALPSALLHDDVGTPVELRLASARLPAADASALHADALMTALAKLPQVRPFAPENTFVH